MRRYGIYAPAMACKEEKYVSSGVVLGWRGCGLPEVSGERSNPARSGFPHACRESLSTVESVQKATISMEIPGDRNFLVGDFYLNSKECHCNEILSASTRIKKKEWS